MLFHVVNIGKGQFHNGKGHSQIGTIIPDLKLYNMNLNTLFINILTNQI